MSDGRVEFDIVGNDKGINQSVKTVTRNIESESKKWDKSANEATSGIEKSFTQMAHRIASALSAAAIGKKLLEWGKAAIDAASDLREVQNVVDTVFGEGAKRIDEWSKKAVSQFGLSETMAKKFTSTLGAMMKSSGLAGNEIISMSTDLAGLAADMSSFYNMDFETAFEKIRSGISGETMPLKQLGINMSVANLEAFALAQGLEKTFSEMDQGEQTMLRYQYLMSVTSDAQGDFAKTSSGYANSIRNIESNIESLKTQLGTPFLSVVEQATGFINELVSSMLPSGEKTYLEKIAEIDIDKETKIKEIEQVAAVARGLAEDLETISGNEDVDKVIANMANSANLLKADSKTNWEGVLSSLVQIDGLENLFGSNDTAVKNISDLATALSGNSPTMTQAEAWKVLLEALSGNLDAVGRLTGKSAEGAAEWLSTIADKAGEINPGDVAAWSELMGVLIGGIDTESDEGRKFVDALVENFLAMGAGSEEAVSALTALGFTTDEISEKQATWLAYCKELVATIPGLSSIIDTNTGEIKGGLPALEDYVDEWERLSKYQAEVAAINKQKSLLEEIYDINALKGKAVANRSKLEALMEYRGLGADEFVTYLDKMAEQAAFRGKHGQHLDLKNFLWEYKNYQHNTGSFRPSDLFSGLTSEEESALEAYIQAVYDYEQAAAVLPVIEQKIQNEMEKTAETYGVTVEEIEGLTDATVEAEKELSAMERAMSGDADAAEDLAKKWDEAGKAVQAIRDYYQGVVDATRQAVDSTIKSFDKIGRAGDDLRQKSSELAGEETDTLNQYSSVWNKWGTSNEDLKRMAESWKSLTDEEKEAYNALAKIRNAQKEVNDQLNQYKPEGMKSNLQSQIDFMEEYLSNLETAQSYGLSDELLASLSDGSKESAEFLKGLVEGGPEAATAVDELYQEVQAKKQTFVEALAEQKLAADQTFQGLVDKAVEAIGDLDLYNEAKESLSNTVLGIADGIGDKIPAVRNAVDALFEQLQRLSTFGLSFEFGVGGDIEFYHGDPIDGEFETGLDRVPFDGFLASLHEGEGILTAEENRIWQRFKNGQVANANVDYDALGGVVRDNIHPGGNVYLDRRIVGRVVSDVQGESYRNLTRSGWQG